MNTVVPFGGTIAFCWGREVTHLLWPKQSMTMRKKKKPDLVMTEYFSVLTGKGLELKLQKSGQIVFKVGDVNLIAPGL